MSEYRGIDLLNFIIFLIKNKFKLILLGFFTCIFVYLFIYFFIPPKFEAKSLVIAKEGSSLSVMGAISQSLNSLPSGLSSMLGGISENDKYDLFDTYIFSRSNLDEIIEKFDLKKEFGTEYMYLAREQLLENIETEITDQNSYKIVTYGSSPEKAVELNSYLLNTINKKVVEYNIKKSKNNRKFLEDRLNEIKLKLKVAENNLEDFQQKNKLFYAEDQIKLIVETYSKFESEIITKEIKRNIVENMHGSDNPTYKLVENEVEALQNKLNNLKYNGAENSMLLALDKLPKLGKEYIRLYREVKIYNIMLEFILPMYEQARFEEQKDLPVLSVIDKPVLAEKKSFPPRTILTLIVTFFIVASVSIIQFLLLEAKNSRNEKINFIYQNLFKLKQ